MRRFIIGLVVGLVWIWITCAQSIDKISDKQKHPILASIVDVKSILLDKPTTFMRGGKSMHARDVILIRICIDRIGEFLPRGIEPPLFMYGNTVAQMLVNPIVSGTAVILAPRPESGETLPLWLTPPGIPVEKMTIKYSQDLLKHMESLASNRIMKLKLPDKMETIRIENVESLRRLLLQKKLNQEKR